MAEGTLIGYRKYKNATLHFETFNDPEIEKQQAQGGGVAGRDEPVHCGLP